MGYYCKKTSYIIYFDAYSSPHKHNKSGWAVIIKRNDLIIMICHGKFKPDMTNNESELRALKEALLTAKFLPENSSKYIFGDSKLSIDLFNGECRTRKLHLQMAVLEAQEIASDLSDYSVGWIGREFNLAGKLLEKLNKNV